MMGQLAVDLTIDSESHKTRIEFLAKFENMPKAQVLSYLTPSASELSLASSSIEGLGTASLSGADLDLVFIRPIVNLRERFVSLHKWEGVVTRVAGESFFAKLTSISSDDPDEEAEFALAEISAGDLPLLRVGAVFYWNIGYHDAAGGQRTRGSIIRFRRLPTWTKREIENARRRAAEIRDYLGWGEPECSSETRRG